MGHDDTEGKTLKFRLLGPLAITLGSQPVTVSGRRQQRILVVLLLSQGAVVSSDQLVEIVWAEHPPSTARSQVAICISSLRQSFAAAGWQSELITTVFPGYRLRTEDCWIDTEEAERLVQVARLAERESRPDDATSALRMALALWRGPVMAGIGSYLIEAAATRWEERRLAILEECCDLELSLGRYQDLIGELYPLVSENPLREPFRAQLMLALYRAGRTAEALDIFREGRQAIVDELGLEPGPELQKFHNAILQGLPADEIRRAGEVAGNQPAPEPNGQAPVPQRLPTPAQLPADSSPFIGRRDELSILDQMLAGQRTSHPAVMLIIGGGGIGKTGLAVYWSRRVATRFPDGQFFADLRGYSDRDEPVAPAAVLELFLRALGMAGDWIPAGLDARVALFRSRLAGRRVLLVLDDAVSSDQVRPLLPGTDGCCVLVTSRQRLDGLVARDGARYLPLGPLDHQDAVTLLQRFTEQAQAPLNRDTAVRVSALCDRWPLAMRIAAARLVVRPYWTVDDLVGRLANERNRLDELSHGELKIRASLSLSYEHLSPRAQSMLRRIALLSVPDFAVWVGAAVLDTSADEAERLIEQLDNAQLLEVRGKDAVGHLRYRMHELTRLYARERADEEDTAAQRRAVFDRCYGCLLALAEEAHRREYGGDYTLIHGQATRWFLDADTVDSLLREPLTWLESERGFVTAAVKQLTRDDQNDLSWNLAMCFITLFESRGFFDDWRDTSEWALDCARRASDVRGEAAMLYSLGTRQLFRQEYVDAQALLSEALTLFSEQRDWHGHALALRNAAFIDRISGRLHQALEAYETALDTLRQVDDRYGEAHVIVNMAQVLSEQGQIAKAEEHLRLALRIFRAIGSRRGEAQALFRLGENLLSQDDPDAAQPIFDQVLKLVRSQSDQIGMVYALLGLGDAFRMKGQSDDAQTILSEALELAETLGERFTQARAHLALGQLAAAEAAPNRAVDQLGQASQIFAHIHAAIWRARALEALGAVYRAQDEPSSAYEAWTAALRLFTASGSPRAMAVAAQIEQLHTDMRATG